MLQRISAGIISGLLMIMPLTVAAQEVTPVTTPAPATTSAPTTTSAPEVKKPVDLSPELNLFMETYFVQLKGKFYDKAYASLREDFRKNMRLMDYKKLAHATHLDDFTSRVWVDKTWDAKTGLITLKGEFVSGTETHVVTFQMMKKGETYEILGISEKLTLNLLGSLFPKDAALQALLVKDLSDLAKAVKSGSFRKLYNSMAKSARKTIKFTTFNKTLKTFRKENKDISLPADAKITIAPDFPKINNDGAVIVNGSYVNGKFTANFTLTYGYEWEWKITGVNVNPVAL